MSITQIIHEPTPDTVASLLEKARALDKRWAEDAHRLRILVRQYDAGVKTAATMASMNRLYECRRELREAFGLEAKNMENK